MEKVSISSLPREIKVKILQELGYNAAGDFIVNSDGERVKDKYVGIEVTVSNMLILPGSTIILDNNELSIAHYMAEYNDKDL